MIRAMDNIEQLAIGYARLYARTTEALMREGVPESRARDEARYAAIAWLSDEQATLDQLHPVDPCPMCGR